MSKTWKLFQYFYCWQPVIRWLAMLGGLLFLVKVLVPFSSNLVTFFLGLFSFGFLMLLPFCSGGTALRILISNNQTSLVPGFRVQAGIAYLVLTVLAAIYLTINTRLFSDYPVSWLFLPRTFICMSLFAGFMQLILPSKYFVATISTAPLVVAMTIFHYKELATSLFLDPTLTIALFLASLAGWGYGLWLLKTQSMFLPPNESVNNTEAWATYDGGFLTRQAIGEPRSAAGTLLLGYPDSWTGIIFRVIYYYLITPMFTTAALYIIGFGEQWEMPMTETVGRIFLLFSLFSAVYCIFIYGELVARARLVWLRHGTDRLAQWKLVESYCLRFLFVYYVCALIVAALSLQFTSVPTNYVTHYLLIVISYCFFNLYLALLLRAKNQHVLIMAIIVIATMIALIFGISNLVSGTSSDPEILIIVELLFLILGFAFRFGTKNSFLGIDWKQVVITSKRRKYALTGE